MFEIILLLFACLVSVLLFLPFLLIVSDIVAGVFRGYKHELNIGAKHEETTFAKDLTEISGDDSDGEGLILFDDTLFVPEPKD